MTVVQIGPTPQPKKYSLSAMMKEICARKYHLDLTLICDDGTLSGHKFFLASQSKFLKNILKEEDGRIAEIILPGVKKEHLKRALRFIYTGKLPVSKDELENGYTVWHVKKIIKDILMIDANLNLGNLKIRVPVEDDDPPDTPPPDPDNPSRLSGSTDRTDNSDRRPAENGNNNGDSVSWSSAGGGSSFRQNSGSIPRQEPEPCLEKKRRESECSEVEVLETPVRPSPEFIDLIESDHEQDASEQAEEKCPEPALETDSIDDLLNSDEETEEDRKHLDVNGPGRKEAEDENPMEPGDEDECPPEPGEDEEDKEEDNPGEYSLSMIVNDNAENDTEVESRQILITEAPKLLRGIEKDSLDPEPKIIKPKKCGQKKKQNKLIKVKTEKPVPPKTKLKSEKSDSRCSSAISNYSTAPKLEPGMIIFRGKIIEKKDKPKPKTVVNKGVRKHNHNAWTLTGLTRVDTIIAIKEESSSYECDKCDAVFQKYRSLDVHIHRIHNDSNKKAKCPECGKKLSSEHAIKKHLLSHRPEEEWPYECPICDKKFQARADIPKHLMTKLHEKDNIPKMGTSEWFDLLYPEKKGELKDLLIKVENQKNKEKKKLENLPAEQGISLEEFESFGPTTQDLNTSSTVINGRKPSADKTSSWAESARVEKRRALVREENEKPVSKRPRRSAATTAAGLLSKMMAEDGL